MLNLYRRLVEKLRKGVDIVAVANCYLPAGFFAFSPSLVVKFVAGRTSDAQRAGSPG